MPEPPPAITAGFITGTRKGFTGTRKGFTGTRKGCPYDDCDDTVDMVGGKKFQYLELLTAHKTY